MNAAIRILAFLLRAGGALAGFAAATLVGDAMLADAVASLGLGALLTSENVRIAAHVAGGIVGLLIGAQVAALLPRGPQSPPGTRHDAAEAVPRLRRHLVDDSGQPPRSALPRYLDPDPAPTKPVGVSFQELGLDHPEPEEYPAPVDRTEPSENDDHDAFAFDDSGERPESAGTASDEWGDAALSAMPPRASSAPPSAAPPSSDLSESETPEPEALAVPPVEPVLDTEPDLQPEPEPDFDPEPEPMLASAPVPEQPVLPPEPHPTAEFSKPEFGLSAANGDADWYQGAGDDDEDAEDDGAGYGSLAAVGLGKSHTPRGPAGQPGEAGLPPADGDAGQSDLVFPQGKPQDFRLREALAELARLRELAA